MIEAIYSAISSKDAHMYEIDKKHLSKVYNTREKKKKEYKTFERKIIYSNGDKKLIMNKSELEKNYFSNYKFFRDYLLSGYESEDIRIELNEIRKILKISKDLRENIQIKFRLENIEDSKNVLENNNINLLQIEDTSDFHQIKKSEMIFEKNSSGKNQNTYDNFVKTCKLFTLKEVEEKIENKPTFKFYSELNTPTDSFSQCKNDKQINNMFLYYKKKITKSFYSEEFFFEFAKYYYPPKKDTPVYEIEPLPQDIRQKFPIDSIESTFRSRGSDSFYNIDSFMSKYGISQKTHLYERDLYENIYDILSKCNYANFLSFLYSKNDLFKYLYNEFTIKKDLINPLEDTKISRIDSYESDDNNTKGEFLSTYQKENKNRRVSLRMGINLEDYYGCYFLDKICFFSEKIDDKVMDYLLDKNQNISLGDDGSNAHLMQKHILNLLSHSSTKEFQHLILISKNERVKITNNSTFSVDNQDLNRAISDIDEDCKRTKFYKIEKNTLLTNSIAENVSLLIEIFNNVKCFYFLEIKTKSNKGRRNSAEISRKPRHDSVINTYYLLRVLNENVERFDMALSQLKLLEQVELQKIQIKRTSVSEKVEKSLNNLELIKASPSSMAKEIQNDSENHKNRKFKEIQNSKKFHTTKELKKKSIEEEDFLEDAQDDGVLDMMFNEFVHKDGDKKRNKLGNLSYESLENKHNPLNSSKMKSYNNEHEDIGTSNNIENINILKNSSQDKKFEKLDANNQFKFQLNSFNSSFNEAGANEFAKNNEINFKDSYVFMIGSLDYKFYFVEKNEQLFLSYYKCGSYDDSAKLKSTSILIREFKDFNIIVKDGKSYHHRIIKLRYTDSNRAPFEIVSHVKNDYERFVNKLEKLVKKGSI